MKGLPLVPHFPKVPVPSPPLPSGPLPREDGLQGKIQSERACGIAHHMLLLNWHNQHDLRADPQASRNWRGLVDELRYSQPSMSDHFRDGHELEETIRELEQGNPLYPPFPLWEVAKINCEGYYLSKDHRTLYCLKELQKRSGRWVKNTIARIHRFVEVSDVGKLGNLRYFPKSKTKTAF